MRQLPWIPATIMTIVTILGFLDAHVGWPMFRAVLSLANEDVVWLVRQAHWVATWHLYARAAWVIGQGLERRLFLGSAAAFLVLLVGAQLAATMGDVIVRSALEMLVIREGNPMNIQNWFTVALGLGLPMAINEAVLTLMTVIQNGDKGTAR